MTLFSSKSAFCFVLFLIIFSVLGVDARRRNESSEEDEDGSGGRHKWPFKKPKKPPVYVKTEAGVVRGYVSRLAGRNKPVNVFKGVPYAEPPLGELRFRKLQKKRTWKGVWNATEYSPACLSNTTRTTSPQNNTDEDCLYVNIFAGKRCSERKSCPVLFYIHGGAFDYDSAVMFNDTEIIRKYASDDIVFVIPAYRLGVFGFLDLGNDDTVPRNLGLHGILSSNTNGLKCRRLDIIFSLNWAQRELEAFGGDPKRVTVFGNSAGATAIQMLCVSPAVPKKLFKQAFISSGEPLLMENVNEVPTREILNEFGCLYDKINKNRTLGDEEKVDCLRRVPALDLLEAQRWFEDERGLLFGGIETDTELLPGKSFAELLPKWKPRTTVFSVVLHEFENRGENMTEECYKDMAVFGYKSEAAFNACLAKYGNVTEQDEYLPISADTFHAEAYIQAYVNALKGGDSYLLSFDLENHTSHANDLTFFFGLHPVQGRNMTPEEHLMDEYYPEMVKRFLRTGKPAKDWQPLDRNGSNYYVLEFSVENDTIVEQPHPVSDYYDPEALKFWLTDMANIERAAEEDENSTSLPWRPTVGNWPFPKGHEHDYDWLTPRPHYRPSAGNWPFPKGKEHDYDWLTPRPHYRPSAGSWPFPKGKENFYLYLYLCPAEV
ncbi:Protein C23H4.4 a [Aphelenchoides avenae]|nr:Protein C23H4.4 a [Aphelenchus avenae]